MRLSVLVNLSNAFHQLRLLVPSFLRLQASDGITNEQLFFVCFVHSIGLKIKLNLELVK